MKYYFAPLEGITGYIYRRAHHTFYPGLDRYYTPFIVPKEKRHLSTKERNDVLPQHNEGMHVIPQVMTNNADEFLRIAGVLYEEYGYTQVNLNLGCPSKTVVSKKRGAGFLSVPDRLDAFFDKACSGLARSGMRLSVKTRIGVEDAGEFSDLLEIFGRYPLAELIVHPRVQKDFYENKPHMDSFAAAYEKQTKAGWELCYNGDIAKAADCGMLTQEFPKLSAVMMGRGLVRNPMLVQEIKVRESGGEGKERARGAYLTRFADAQAEKAERNRRYEMYRCLRDDYAAVLSGEKDVLFKMKELWLYMSLDFTEPQQYLKKMKKAQRLADFEAAAAALCREQRLLENVKEAGINSRKDDYETDEVIFRAEKYYDIREKIWN